MCSSQGSEEDQNRSAALLATARILPYTFDGGFPVQEKKQIIYANIFKYTELHRRQILCTAKSVVKTVFQKAS